MAINPLLPGGGVPPQTPRQTAAAVGTQPLPGPPPNAPPQSPIMGPPAVAPMPVPSGPMVVPFPGGAPPPPMPQPPAQPLPPGTHPIHEALRQAGIKLPPGEAMDKIDLGRKSPRGNNQHIYEIVAKDLAQWLDTMPKILATAMRGGPNLQGPFKHAATGQQKYEIYKAKLFNPDGTVNMQGRQELLRRMTPKQYAEVVHIVTREMKRTGEAQRAEAQSASPEEAEGE